MPHHQAPLATETGPAAALIQIMGGHPIALGPPIPADTCSTALGQALWPYLKCVDTRGLGRLNQIAQEDCCVVHFVIESVVPKGDAHCLEAGILKAVRL